jgi:hypothetical protein
MKITTEVKGFESFGEIENRNFSVDTEDTMIIRLLRDKMYSNKIGAVSREIASNSRDANREAGIPNIPITIKLEKSQDSLLSDSEFLISFKDNGIGISPERMENVFLKYGSSTKRDSNKFTGGFGIGAKTPFAYTDTFYINTVVEENGIKNKYYYQASITSDGTKEVSKMITLDVEETTEKTGTEIIVPILEKDVESFEREVMFTTRFWSVMPNFIGFKKIDEPNIVYHTDEFLVVVDSMLGNNSKYIALIDEIPYILNDDTLREINKKIGVLNKESFTFNKPFLKYIYIFKTGEISVSGSREEIEYIDSNIEKFKKVNSIIQDKGEKLLYDYCHNVSSYKEMCIVKNSITLSGLHAEYIHGISYENLTKDMNYILFLSSIDRNNEMQNNFFTDNYDFKFKGEIAIRKIQSKTLDIKIFKLSDYEIMRATDDLTNHYIGSRVWDLPMYILDQPRMDASKNAQLKQMHPDGYILITNKKEDKIILLNNESIEKNRKETFNYLNLLNINLLKYSEVEKLKKITDKSKSKKSEIVKVPVKVYYYNNNVTQPKPWVSIDVEYDKKNKNFINLIEKIKGVGNLFSQIKNVVFVEKETLSSFNNTNISYGNVPALSKFENGIRKILFSSDVLVIGVGSSKSQYFKDAKITTLTEATNDLLKSKKVKDLNIIKALKYSLCQKLNLNAEMFSQIEMPKEIKNSFIKLKGEFENFNIENETNIELLKGFNNITIQLIIENEIKFNDDFLENYEIISKFINENPLLKVLSSFQNGGLTYFNTKPEIANPIYEQFIELFNNKNI